LSETEPQENPLINNKKLRQMYLTMIEARILDEHIAKLQRNVKTRQKLGSTYGQEACRVGTAIELTAGDLVSDSQPGVVMDHILGDKAETVLKRLASLISREKNTESGAGTKQLPWIDDSNDRLRLALGAALSFKTLKKNNLVVSYVSRGEATGGSWRRLLKLSAQLELPIIFVVLPGAANKKKTAAIPVSGKARSAGIPGIPVDSSDAVALYRVAQESIGRVRGGGGAVVIDCVAYPVHGKAPDPTDQMKRFVLGKKAATADWLDHAGDSFREKISRKSR
jgi:TPP-dependent pyruvate/acetoin dehydrogenase alpha subunit